MAQACGGVFLQLQRHRAWRGTPELTLPSYTNAAGTASRDAIDALPADWQDRRNQ